MSEQVPKPIFRQHTFKQECSIAEMQENKLPAPIVGYEFNDGKRKFLDKVDRKKSYD
jgi:hypothetical protein